MGVSWSTSSSSNRRRIIQSSQENQPPQIDGTPLRQIPVTVSSGGLRRRLIHRSRSHSPPQLLEWTPLRPQVEIPGSSSGSGSRIIPSSDQNQLPPPSLPRFFTCVNVHRHSLRLEVDEQNPDYHLITFVFDALFDGSVTIFYLAKGRLSCQFQPLIPETYPPVKVPFQKGLRQKFHQPPGTGVDLAMFELVELSTLPQGEDFSPVVISAETYVAADPSPSASPFRQITEALIDKNSRNVFHLRVLNQFVWIDGAQAQVRDISALGSSTAVGFTDDDPFKDCVVCWGRPNGTAVLPCGHMCMCRECAARWRQDNGTCPLCRGSIESLMYL